MVPPWKPRFQHRCQAGESHWKGQGPEVLVGLLSIQFWSISQAWYQLYIHNNIYIYNVSSKLSLSLFLLFHLGLSTKITILAFDFVPFCHNIILVVRPRLSLPGPWPTSGKATGCVVALLWAEGSVNDKNTGRTGQSWEHVLRIRWWFPIGMGQTSLYQFPKDIR
jgi:hypothetical protein